MFLKSVRFSCFLFTNVSAFLMRIKVLHCHIAYKIAFIILGWYEKLAATQLKTMTQK